jgi:hypothetical protein
MHVKLLPEGHLENEYHFQDQPAESGQKICKTSTTSGQKFDSNSWIN